MPDVFEQVAELGWPDYESERATVERLAQRPGGPRSLGRLGEIAQWLAAVQASCPPRDPAVVHAVVVAADHGIAAAGVSAQPDGATAARLATIADGSAGLISVAELVGAQVHAVDVGVDVPGEDAPRSGRIDREDALSIEDVGRGIDVGAAVADERIDAGAELLVVSAIGVGATTPAATIISVLTATEPTKVIGRGSGVDDAAWMRKATAIRDARLRGVRHRAAPLELLACCGGPDQAVLVGLLVRAAVRKVPVVIDGVVPGAAALLAREIQPRIVRWWRAGPATGDPGYDAVLRALGLTPLLDVPADETLTAGLGLPLGDGTGGLLAVPVIRAAARLV